MASEVDPLLYEHPDDSPTEPDTPPIHKSSICTDNNNNNLDPGEECCTARPNLVRESAQVHADLPEEIPDSQESLDLSDSPEGLEDDSFHTDQTVVLIHGTQITQKPKPQYVSQKTSLPLLLYTGPLLFFASWIQDLPTLNFYSCLILYPYKSHFS